MTGYCSNCYVPLAAYFNPYRGAGSINCENVCICTRCYQKYVLSNEFVDCSKECNDRVKCLGLPLAINVTWNATEHVLITRK